MTADGPAGRGRLRESLSLSALARAPRRRRIIAAVTGLVIVIAAVAAGRELTSSSEPDPPSATNAVTPPAESAPPAAAAPPAVPAGFVRSSGDGAGFSIAYPKRWSPVASGDSDVKLLVAGDRGASLLARVAPTGLGDVTTDTLPVVRSLTDRLVRADGRVQLRGEPQALVLDGLPGYRYDYTFAAANGRGAHVHYFLFKGSQLITLVFQALPAQRLQALSPLFDRAIETFRSRVP